MNYMRKNGYTLIELLVALAVFTVVVAAPTGFFVSALKGQQKALASQELYDNVSYTLEYMSRSLRMARKDLYGDCTGVPNTNYVTTNGHNIEFMNYNGDCQEFFLDPDDNYLKETKNDDTLFLTARNLKVISFNVGGHGWVQNDGQQPEVTLFLEIRGNRGSLPELQPTIKIQTSISQRNLDAMH